MTEKVLNKNRNGMAMLLILMGTLLGGIIGGTYMLMTSGENGWLAMSSRSTFSSGST